MNVLYCRLGGSLRNTLHVDSLRTLSADVYEAHSADELTAIIAQTGATQVMFAFPALPRKAVSVADAKLARHIKRVIGYLK